MNTTTRSGMVEVIQTPAFAAEIKRRAERLKTKSLITIGMVVMSDAKQLCAVQYGYLAASIQTASNEKSTKLDSPGSFAEETPPAGHDVGTFRPINNPTSKDQVYVGSAVDYAPYVEYGTRRSNNAQPFLRPALNMAQGKVPTIVKNGAKLEFGDYKP